MLNALFDMSTDADTGVLDVMPDIVPDIDVSDIDRAATSATPEPTLAARRGASVQPE